MKPTHINDRYAALTLLFRSGVAGDAYAYQRFLSSIVPILRRAVGRKLPASEVEDTVQEILISVHKARHTFDGQRPLMPWLMAIVHFRMVDSLRKVYVDLEREYVGIEELAEFLPDVTKTEEANESLDVLLTHVSEREQRILTLMYVEGYTAKEAAARLDMKENAVKVAAHRAIKKIREKMGAS